MSELSSLDLIFSLIKVLVVVVNLLNMGAIVTWVERKQSALMQDRVGANRAYLRLPFTQIKLTVIGLIHGLADGAKMLLKENWMPSNSNVLVHTLSVYFSVVPVFVTFAVVPFGPIVNLSLFFQAWYLAWIPGLSEWAIETFGNYQLVMQVAQLDIGILYVLGITGLGVFGATLAGWCSNNKFSLLGALRSSAQMVSYEVSMGLSIIGLIMIFNTFDPMIMVQKQGELLFGFLPAWGIFVQPLSFILFFTCAIAENKRIPFDLPEAESELVSGYFTEYSAMKMGLFMLSEFVTIIVIAGLVATLFLGGWQVPYLMEDGFHFPLLGVVNLSYATVVILQMLSFVFKAAFLIWFQILIRWTLPRFRYDQLMHLGWKVLLPLSLINMMATATILLLT